MAAAALSMCAEFGSQVPGQHLLRKLAGIAAGGRMTSNAERDLHVILQKHNDFDIELEWVPARMWCPKQTRIIKAQVPVLMPDKVASAIWHRGRDVFEHFVMGDMSRSDVQAYWDHVYRTSDWYRCHPSSALDRAGQIPLSLYGDEVCTYKNSEIGNIMVLSWTSDFSYGRDPLGRYMLLTVYSEHTACQHTYGDIMKAVCERITMMQDPARQWPWSQSFNFMYSSCQGDLKYLMMNHNIHHYTSNRFCSWCQCVKDDPDGNVGMTLGDMRENAEHLDTAVTNDEYLRTTSPQERVLAALRF